MQAAKPVDGLAVGLMAVLCAIWGFQQVTLKAAAPDVAPVFQLALRSGGAALLVILLMTLRREWRYTVPGSWRPGLAVGGLFALEFLLVGEGLRYTTASHMVVFLYTAPIFAALGLHYFLPHERLNAVQWLGILVAFAGTAVAFSGKLFESGGGQQLWGDALGLLGAVAWAATTLTARCTRLATARVSLVLLYQLVGAFVLLFAASLFSGQAHFNPTPIAVASLTFQTLVVSFGSFLAWFWLLGNYLASRVGVLSFMTPLFGVVFGVVLLGEPLEPAFVVGAALVMAGILLVSGHEYLRRRATGLRSNIR
ncbi:DMT family transporter [Pseudomonas sp. Marseille-Q5115]|uniref:DMT family transporter n=1 Tax=Pseudomonas sp. Marseille-Q5115 TaxID=2866593 RepID=UPI001CE4A178|nr:DMT family transporter [Pseudomonas sp. Marseille-Q5115]